MNSIVYMLTAQPLHARFEDKLCPFIEMQKLQNSPTVSIFYLTIIQIGPRVLDQCLLIDCEDNLRHVQRGTRSPYRQVAD